MGLTEQQAKFFRDTNFASVGTIRPDGSAHMTPVWIDYDGEHVLFNTAYGRAKVHHIQRDPRVTIEVTATENPYSYVEVTGTAELVDEGADEHIDKMAKKYIGEDLYPWRQPGERRVIVRVKPERVSSSGVD
jgi:PPOX class probable F420-dependent enzyme